MCLFVMYLKFFIISIVDILQSRCIEVADFTLEVRTISKMHLKSLNIVEPFGTKLTMRMVEEYFSAFAKVTLF